MSADNLDQEKKDAPAKATPEEETFEDEKVSYSFLFFLMSGALMLITVWAFWDDEYSRRGYKDYQEAFFKAEYERAEKALAKTREEIASKELEIKNSLANEEESLEASEEYQKLAEEVREAKVHYDEHTEIKKFEASRLDEYYYYYKKAQHEGKNSDVQLARVKESEKKLKEFAAEEEVYRKDFEEKEAKLLAMKAKQENLQKELRALTSERSSLERKMDFYKPFPFVWRLAEIKQTVIPASGRNNFSEIIYKVDRCMTCHISYWDPYYKDAEEPLKSHPNLDILIKKHPPEVTGCTWCHKGQGTATAPAEDAHGSHHEMDQTMGINEPILRGNYTQSLCQTCHAQVVEVEGAPLLNKGKKLFIELGCHGCHLADGFQKEPKVGPRLLRIASKVNPTWLYEWIKNPEEYLPKTRMPNFRLNNKDAVAITSYLVSASDKTYQPALKFKGGDKANGQKIFESVGCLACHELNGKGEHHAPDLSHIARKVNPDWLVSWVSNPKDYNHKSLMPSLRLTEQEAQDVASYLLQFGKPRHIKNIDKLIQDPETIAKGEKLVRRRGCFACHDVKGMEKEGRIAPELSAFGSKQVIELEFGDSHVTHTWESWARNKLKEPMSYRTERILDKMPKFNLSDDEIDALLVLLRGFVATKVPEKFRDNLSDKEEKIERGRRLVTRYNCRGCHHVEGKGGDIQKYIKATADYPPPLELDSYHVGERIKGSWLFSFLKEPTRVRKWLKVKMPTFNLTDEQLNDLTAYFQALSPEEIPYEEQVHKKPLLAEVETGSKIVNYMDCGNCHDEGAKGIEFSIASDRLKKDWIPKWLKDTREMIPWTKMPSHWPKEDGKYTIPTKYRELKTVEGGNLDVVASNISSFIEGYNSVDFDNSKVLGEVEEPEEEEGGDEGDGDEGDGGGDDEFGDFE